MFEVTRENNVDVLTNEPDDSRRAAVELAVKYCPTHALKIVENEENR